MSVIEQGGLSLAAASRILVLLVAGGLLFGAGCEHSSCSCAAFGSPREALTGSTAVFAGEVTDIGRPFIFSSRETVEVTFRVSRVWKGPVQRTLVVTTPRREDCCGYDDFEVGERYLVYAGSPGETVSKPGVDGFSTKPLSAADEDLTALGKGKRP